MNYQIYPEIERSVEEFDKKHNTISAFHMTKYTNKDYLDPSAYWGPISYSGVYILYNACIRGTIAGNNLRKACVKLGKATSEGAKELKRLGVILSELE